LGIESQVYFEREGEVRMESNSKFYGTNGTRNLAENNSLCNTTKSLGMIRKLGADGNERERFRESDIRNHHQ